MILLDGLYDYSPLRGSQKLSLRCRWADCHRQSAHLQRKEKKARRRRARLKERGIMFRIQRRTRLRLLSAILLCLFVFVCLAAWKRSGKSSSSRNTVVKHSVDTPAEEVLKYWTDEKMRHARPADLPNVDAIDQEKQHPHRPQRKPGSRQE